MVEDCKFYTEQGGIGFCRCTTEMLDECFYKDGIQCKYYESDPRKVKMTLAEAEENDTVNHPSHYTYGKYECIDVIFDILSEHKDPISAWLTGQIVKYMWRWPNKNGLEDLKKAQFYLNRLVEYEEDINE